MKKFIILLFLIICTALHTLQAQQKERKLAFENYHYYYSDAQKVKDVDKETSINRYRRYFAENSYRGQAMANDKTRWKDYLQQLGSDGVFKDMLDEENKFRDSNQFQSNNTSVQSEIGLFVSKAFNRLWHIAEACRRGDISEKEAMTSAYKSAILHYGDIEAERSNIGARFHESCFAMPRAAVNIYFSFFDLMEKAEAGKADKQLTKVCDMLKVIALQAWTQPLRNDDTDKNVVQIDRFRKHVWWVGGNALDYRALLPVAFMYRSVPMVDLLAEICQRSISTTSQVTFNDSFWTEGFTVDGAGWGHGKQCLVWGYPIDGTIGALNIMNTLKQSPWEMQLNRENVEALMNFLRGSNWFYYKGYSLPCVDRYSMRYSYGESGIRYYSMLRTLINDWGTSFRPDELAELNQLYEEAGQNAITMENMPQGIYQGTRWFFNNDKLIKKNPDYHIIVNMASVRCDGLESAMSMADAYNLFTTDGMTLFQKTGNEYKPIYGAFDVTASPGVTAREGMDRLTPVTNWRGYCSQHNFAAAATLGGNNAVAGFIFEKMDANGKGSSDKQNKRNRKNKVIYGVKAHKAWFMMGDYIVSLGAGITNLQPEMEGSIRTSIDQTSYQGELTIISNKGSRPAGNEITSFMEDNKLVWVQHPGKFAYTVLPQYTDNAWFKTETRDTDWLKMNVSNSGRKDLPEKADVLYLWIDHGQKPVNDTYGYVVYAGSGAPESVLPFDVLRNDTVIQAVCSSDKSIIEAIFYQENANLESDGISLSVSAPCAVLIEDRIDTYAISVTDAKMNSKLTEITLILNNVPLRIEMPQGEYCGKPAVATITKKTVYSR